MWLETTVVGGGIKKSKWYKYNKQQILREKQSWSSKTNSLDSSHQCFPDANHFGSLSMRSFKKAKSWMYLSGCIVKICKHHRWQDDVTKVESSGWCKNQILIRKIWVRYLVLRSRKAEAKTVIRKTHLNCYSASVM